MARKRWYVNTRGCWPEVTTSNYGGESYATRAEAELVAAEGAVRQWSGRLDSAIRKRGEAEQEEIEARKNLEIAEAQLRTIRADGSEVTEWIKRIESSDRG
jgi:hypothetical protein